MNVQAASPGGGAPSRARLGWRFLRGRQLTSWREVRGLLVSLVLSFVVLSFTIWVMPGVTASARVDVLIAAAVLGVLAALLGPLVTSFALLLGWVGVLAAAVFAEAVFFYAALALTPGIHVGGFWDVFWSSWVYSLLMTVVTWLVSAGDDTGFLSYLLRQSRRSRTATTDLHDAGCGLHPGRRAAGTVAAVGDPERGPADADPVGALGQPRRDVLGRAAPVHHTRQPGRAAARRQRAGAGVPVVREGVGPVAGGQPPQGRRRDPAAAERRSRAAGRRGREHLQHLHRRRPDRAADDEQRHRRGPPRAVPRLRRVLHQPLRAEPLPRAVGGGDAQGAVPGPSTAAPRRAAPDQPARLLRAAPGRHERAAARPQRRADRRADDGRGPVAVLRLHRLRRDRPPRRSDPAGVAGLAGRPRPPHRGAAGGLHARPAAV